jgi:hypothetical protein
MALAKLQPRQIKMRPADRSRSRARTFGLLAAAAALGAIAVIAYFPDNLVTLDVKDADVQQVVKSIARQSGETILIAPEATGAVTINVRKQPVGNVLEIITTQLGGRWQEFYALSDGRDSIEVLKKSLTEGGQAQGWRVRGFGWGAADGDEFDWIPMPDKISYEAVAKPARDVALALSLRMRSRVVVCESIGSKTVTCVFKNDAPADAVRKFARELNAATDRFFCLRIPTWRENSPTPMARGGDIFIPDASGAPPDDAGRGRGRQGAPFRARDAGTLSADRAVASFPTAAARINHAPAPSTSTAQTLPSSSATHSAAWPRGGLVNLSDADRQRLRAEQQRLVEERDSTWQARLDAMPPQQRQRAEQLRAALTEFRQQARTMSRDQRAEAMRRIVSTFPELLDQRLERSLERLKSTTPEQRLQRARTLFERQKAREQRQPAPQSPADIPPAAPQ